MAISAVCPTCKVIYPLTDRSAGKRVRCKVCQNLFVVPNAPTRIPPAASPVRRAGPPPKRGKLPWLIGLGALGLLLLIGGGVALAILSRRPPPDPVAAGNDPPKNPKPAPAGDKKDPPPGDGATKAPPRDGGPKDPPPDKDKDGGPKEQPKDKDRTDPGERPVVARNSELPRDVVDRVNRATVFLRVTMADGTRGSGSGFFGAPTASQVLTNAHVVGMLSKHSRPPQEILVILNSGEKNEQTLRGRVLGVDRDSDLALVDVGAAPGLPEPLKVRPASGLVQTQKVWVFGFPFGGQLTPGKNPEITVSSCAVTALRKKDGALEKVQVNEGMNPGNSGGPVVDDRGDVVGVAFSGIRGAGINFAIPGERVPRFLNGRSVELAVGPAFHAADGKPALPVTVQMIDPRGQVRDAALEVWTGDPGKPRPPSEGKPEARPGDSERRRVALAYADARAQGEAGLPDLPEGKVYWIQPSYVDGAGEKRWGQAQTYTLQRDLVLERKPALLQLKPQRGANRTLDLTTRANMQVGDGDEPGQKWGLITTVQLKENVQSASPRGATLALRYEKADRELIAGEESRGGLLEKIQPVLNRLQAVRNLDGEGNPVGSDLAAGALDGLPRATADRLQHFHEPTRFSLDALAVRLPNETMQPGGQWKAVRPLAIVIKTAQFEKGKIDLTYTYMGRRKRNGRDEAVINLAGTVRGAEKDSEAKLSGTVSGQAVVDLATGEAVLAQTNVGVGMEVELKGSSDGPQMVEMAASLELELQRSGQ
jgi:hypothetical protein